MADAIQEVLQDNPFPVVDYESPGGMGYTSVLSLFGSSEDVPPEYWSRGRDIWLRSFARKSDPIKVAVKTYISKATTIPVRVLPLDASVSRHVKQAEMMQLALIRNSGFFKGWDHEFQKFLFDYLTQDNGAFMMILGGGNVSGPIVGAASGVIHLESGRCNRTRNPVYPVVYYHDDGKRYKLHYTRVLDMVSMPSSELDMNGVGHCPVSLCVDGATELRSITTYSLEKMGTRPARQILYAKTGATLEQMNGAIAHWKNKLDSEQLIAFAKTLLLAPLMPSGKLELDMIDLASTPDGFDRQSVSLLDMALIAAAFGLDLRDLAHSFGVSGQTKSDAEVQDRKGRGKGVGEMIETFSKKLTERFLPAHLRIAFDNLDDSQDEQVARIRSERAMARSRDIAGGVLTERAARLSMLREGEITDAEMEEMELMDGRLMSGVSVLSLFHSTSLPYTRLLKVTGFTDITEIADNDPEKALKELHKLWISAVEALEGAGNYEQQRATKRAIAAIEKLKEEYEEAAQIKADEEAQQQQMDMQQNNPIMQGNRNAGVKPKPKTGAAQSGKAPFGRQATPLSEGNPADDKAKEVARVNPTRARFQPRSDVDFGTATADAVETFNTRYPDYIGLLSGQRGWVYDNLTHQYRNTIDGRIVTQDQLEQMIDALPEQSRESIGVMVEMLEGNGDLDIWYSDAADMLTEAMTMMYLLGAGGTVEMTDEMWADLGATIGEQFDYLTGFAESIAIGTLTRAQIAARFMLYMRQTRSSFWRGYAGTRGLILPAYPGDGNSECGVACGCRWAINETVTHWICTWLLSPLLENCNTCVNRSQTWANLLIAK